MEQVTIFNHGFLSKPSKAFNTILKRSSRLPQDKTEKKSNPGRVPNHLNYCTTTGFKFTYITVQCLEQKKIPALKNLQVRCKTIDRLARQMVGTVRQQPTSCEVCHKNKESVKRMLHGITLGTQQYIFIFSKQEIVKHREQENCKLLRTTLCV